MTLEQRGSEGVSWLREHGGTGRSLRTFMLAAGIFPLLVEIVPHASEGTLDVPEVSRSAGLSTVLALLAELLVGLSLNLSMGFRLHGATGGSGVVGPS